MMKKRYLILIGAVLGWAANFGLYAYGDYILQSATEKFKEAIKTNTATITYAAPQSESKISILWAEDEPVPWKDQIQVRIGTPKDKNVRVIIFKKQ